MNYLFFFLFYAAFLSYFLEWFQWKSRILRRSKLSSNVKTRIEFHHDTELESRNLSGGTSKQDAQTDQKLQVRNTNNGNTRKESDRTTTIVQAIQHADTRLETQIGETELSTGILRPDRDTWGIVVPVRGSQSRAKVSTFCVLSILRSIKFWDRYVNRKDVNEKTDGKKQFLLKAIKKFDITLVLGGIEARSRVAGESGDGSFLSFYSEVLKRTLSNGKDSLVDGKYVQCDLDDLPMKIDKEIASKSCASNRSTPETEIKDSRCHRGETADRTIPENETIVIKLDNVVATIRFLVLPEMPKGLEIPLKIIAGLESLIQLNKIAALSHFDDDLLLAEDFFPRALRGMETGKTDLPGEKATAKGNKSMQNKYTKESDTHINAEISMQNKYTKESDTHINAQISKSAARPLERPEGSPDAIPKVPESGSAPQEEKTPDIDKGQAKTATTSPEKKELSFENKDTSSETVRPLPKAETMSPSETPDAPETQGHPGWVVPGYRSRDELHMIYGASYSFTIDTYCGKFSGVFQTLLSTIVLLRQFALDNSIENEKKEFYFSQQERLSIRPGYLIKRTYIRDSRQFDVLRLEGSYIGFPFRGKSTEKETEEERVVFFAERNARKNGQAPSKNLTIRDNFELRLKEGTGVHHFPWDSDIFATVLRDKDNWKKKRKEIDNQVIVNQAKAQADAREAVHAEEALHLKEKRIATKEPSKAANARSGGATGDMLEQSGDGTRTLKSENSTVSSEISSSPTFSSQCSLTTFQDTLALVKTLAVKTKNLHIITVKARRRKKITIQRRITSSPVIINSGNPSSMLQASELQTDGENSSHPSSMLQASSDAGMVHLNGAHASSNVGIMALHVPLNANSSDHGLNQSLLNVGTGTRNSVPVRVRDPDVHHRNLEIARNIERYRNLMLQKHSKRVSSLTQGRRILEQSTDDMFIDVKSHYTRSDRHFDTIDYLAWSRHGNSSLSFHVRGAEGIHAAKRECPWHFVLDACQRSILESLQSDTCEE